MPNRYSSLVSPRHLSRRRLLAGSVGLSAALAIQPPTRAATRFAAATPSVSAAFSGRVDIGGGRSLWLESRGIGSPTVVLEAGAGNDADIWDTVALPPHSKKAAVLPVSPPSLASVPTIGRGRCSTRPIRRIAAAATPC